MESVGGKESEGEGSIMRDQLMMKIEVITVEGENQHGSQKYSVHHAVMTWDGYLTTYRNKKDVLAIYGPDRWRSIAKLNDDGE